MSAISMSRKRKGQQYLNLPRTLLLVLVLLIVAALFNLSTLAYLVPKDLAQVNDIASSWTSRSSVRANVAEPVHHHGERQTASSEKDELDIKAELRATGPTTPQTTAPTTTKIVVWAYPLPPKVSQSSWLELANDETLWCAYPSACQGYAHKMIQLRKLTLGTAFQDFIQSQMINKVKHKQQFPDHVQSVALLSLLEAHPGSTVRAWGDSTVVSADAAATVRRAGYHPTAWNSKAPLIPTSRPDLSTLHFLGIQFHRGTRGNSGDEIQAFAGTQFAPFLSRFVDRDSGWSEQGLQGTAIVNSWYGNEFHYPRNLLNDVNMTFVALHYSDKGMEAVRQPDQLHVLREYTRSFGPIGARDTASLAFLRDELGLQTFLSRCMTFLLQLGCHCNDCPSCDDPVRFPKNEVIFNDVRGMSPELEEEIKSKHNVTVVRADMRFKRNNKKEFEYAYNMLDMYARRAKLVVTSRLHSAMPAIMLGTPVVFVNTPKLPGGGGNRLAGYLELMHTFDPTTEKWTIDPDHPPEGIPGAHVIDRHRAALWNVLTKRSMYYEETGRLFGMVPIRRLGVGRETPGMQRLFHFVFDLDGDRDFPWQLRRAIESVFYHHPNARVLIHSNSPAVMAKNSRLFILVDAGYSLEILSYDLKELLPGWDDEEIAKFKGRDETDLVSLLTLQKEGGVYLSGDTFLRQPLTVEHQSVMGMSNSETGLSMMSVDQGRTELDKAIQWARSSFVPRTSSSRLTTVLQDNGLFGGLKPLDPADFDPFTDHWESCFSDLVSEGSPMSGLMVHIPAAVLLDHDISKPETICDQLLYQFCILCDEMHSEHVDIATK